MTAGARRKPVLLYGSNGYTARLLLPRLRALGIDVIVAGRNATAIHRVAEECRSTARVFGLEDPRHIDECLHDVSAVLNAAGPFSRTAPPLIDACLRQRVDYLDLSGELEPITYAATSGAFARSLGVMLLPAIGFDVVPSDCLAVHLANGMPGAERLTLSISASNLLSRGSARTFVENAGTWVHVRREGALEPMRLRTQTRWIDFGGGQRPTIAVSWGDLVTAFHSTGIPNIEVYFEATAFRWTAVTVNQYFGWALRGDGAKAWLDGMAKGLPDGPGDQERARERSVIVAEVSRGTERRGARLVTPEAYTFTAEVASRVALEVLGGKRTPGFVTPARLFGADFVLGVPGVTLEHLS
jgi:short subunit dehydrogenase-like uncharacterized protein